jgi:hypothetical protein
MMPAATISVATGFSPATITSILASGPLEGPFPSIAMEPSTTTSPAARAEPRPEVPGARLCHEPTAGIRPRRASDQSVHFVQSNSFQNEFDCTVWRFLPVADNVRARLMGSEDRSGR